MYYSHEGSKVSRQTPQKDADGEPLPTLLEKRAALEDALARR